MGPSVKFVLPIIDAFPNKKNGGNFWCGKKGHNGRGEGGSEGVAFFGRNFSRLSFLNTSLRYIALHLECHKMCILQCVTLNCIVLYCIGCVVFLYYVALHWK